jgi:thymidylate kinase
MPDRFESDLDFMVDHQDFEDVPTLIQEIADATNTILFQSIPHEATARAYRLASQTESVITFIQPDSCSDYRHFGRLWLRADEILGERRWHPNGFWVPSTSHEFIYYLIKRLNKRDFTKSQGDRLADLYAEDSKGCDILLGRFWRQPLRLELARMAHSGDWAPLITNLESFRQDLIKHSPKQLSETASSYWKGVEHTLERVLEPTGGWIAFIGPDGCGKSSVIESVIKEFSPAFQKVLRFHLRPTLFPARTDETAVTTDPHGKPLRSALVSVAKMLYLGADYFLGYWIRIWPATLRTKLVVFDRYFYDILIDYKRVRYGGPKWFLGFIVRFLPRPDLVILLNAPAEVLWSRKQEVAFEEVVRQQKAYLLFAQDLKSVAIVDASQSISAVVHDAAEAIIANFSSRTRTRLKLARKDARPRLATSCRDEEWGK